MPNPFNRDQWEDEADERTQRCVVHNYDGSERPTGIPCARCLKVWAEKQAERFSRAEFSMLRAQQA